MTQSLSNLLSDLLRLWSATDEVEEKALALMAEGTVYRMGGHAFLRQDDGVCLVDLKELDSTKEPHLSTPSLPSETRQETPSPLAPKTHQGAQPEPLAPTEEEPAEEVKEKYRRGFNSASTYRLTPRGARIHAVISPKDWRKFKPLSKADREASLVDALIFLREGGELPKLTEGYKTMVPFVVSEDTAREIAEEAKERNVVMSRLVSELMTWVVLQEKGD
jgi:hypothetical protein